MPEKSEFTAKNKNHYWYNINKSQSLLTLQELRIFDLLALSFVANKQQWMMSHSSEWGHTAVKGASQLQICHTTAALNNVIQRQMMSCSAKWCHLEGYKSSVHHTLTEVLLMLVLKGTVRITSKFLTKKKWRTIPAGYMFGQSVEFLRAKWTNFLHEKINKWCKILQYSLIQ